MLHGPVVSCGTVPRGSCHLAAGNVACRSGTHIRTQKPKSVAILKRGRFTGDGSNTCSNTAAMLSVGSRGPVDRWAFRSARPPKERWALPGWAG